MNVVPVHRVTIACLTKFKTHHVVDSTICRRQFMCSNFLLVHFTNTLNTYIVRRIFVFVKRIYPTTYSCMLYVLHCVKSQYWRMPSISVVSLGFIVVDSALRIKNQKTKKNRTYEARIHLKRRKIQLNSVAKDQNITQNYRKKV